MLQESNFFRRSRGFTPTNFSQKSSSILNGSPVRSSHKNIQPPSSQKNMRGFTLVELLVVVAIIGLLSSVVVTTVSTVRIKAKEARVGTEVHNIRLAFEEYASEHSGYPNPGNGSIWCIGATGTTHCKLAGEPVGNPTDGWDLALIPDKANPNAQYLAAADELFYGVDFSGSPSFKDTQGFENKGYIYVSCKKDVADYPVCPENPDPTDPDQIAYLIYSKSDNVLAIEVFGEFREQTCSVNPPCVPPESGGDNTCGNGSQNCAEFCSSDSAACNYDPNGTNSTCDYSCVSSCSGTLSPDCSGGTDYSSCSLAPGCLWGGGSTSYCTGSPGVTCEEQSIYYESVCESHIGCTWQDDTSGQCSGTPSDTCSGGDYGSCNSVSGCSWGGGSAGYCSGTQTGSCSDFSDASACNTVTGCSWGGASLDSCSGTPTASCDGGDENSCNATSGCSWNWDWGTFTYSCGGTPTASCNVGDAGSCNAIAGCSWGGGTLDSCSGSYYVGTCDGFDSSSCNNTSGCGWVEGTPDSCSGTPTASCDGDENSCSTITGCSWQGGSPAQCTGTISCVGLGDYDSCEDYRYGCNWMPGGVDYCSTDPSASCSGFTDEGTCINASGCEWVN